ncbi:MAG: phosphodiester glycosidase family protein [Deltaproteobacteria bacterium]
MSTPALLLTLAAAPWQPLADGVEYRRFEEPTALHVVRIDPAKAELAVLTASEAGGGKKTARAWVEGQKLLVAINAGMFAQDHSSNVGHLRVGQHVNQARWDPRYKSVLLIDPKAPKLPRAQLVDRPHDPSLTDRYGTVLQNLRLIRSTNGKTGKNVWSKQKKRWSEAAVAYDREGRILFVFSRAPYAMWRFNARLLALDLGVIRAFHAEGGPEASLSIRSPKLKLHLAGSYETDFNENDDNAEQWPIPNILAVRAP